MNRSEDDEFDTWLREADTDLTASVAASLDTENMLMHVKQRAVSEQAASEPVLGSHRTGEPTPMLIRASALDELAVRLARIDAPLTRRWDEVDRCFRSWVTPGLRSHLRNHLLELSSEEAGAVIARSRETTTHFAWCLRDRPNEPFTFWLHEYKPQQSWRPGYAYSVHNHRHHFCTTVVRGGYVHERYQAEIDPITEMISDAVLVESTPCEVGAVGTVLSDEFHRIPLALDSTITFLVKSRVVCPWSLSFDPYTGISHRHVPVESELDRDVPMAIPVESRFHELVSTV